MDKLSFVICGICLFFCAVVTPSAALVCFQCDAFATNYKCASEDLTFLQEFIRDCKTEQTVCRTERYFSNHANYAEDNGRATTGWRLRRFCSVPPTDQRYTNGRWHNVTRTLEGKDFPSDTEVYYCATNQCRPSDKSGSAALSSTFSLLAVAAVLSKYSIV